MNLTLVRSRRAQLGLVTVLTIVLVAAEVVFLREWVTTDPARFFPDFTGPLLTDAVLAVAAVGYVLLRLPAVQAWTCVLVLACGVGGDLQLDQFGGGAWLVTGAAIAAMGVPALLALVLRYPSARLTTAARAWVGVSVVLALSATAADLLFRAQGWSMVWVSPLGRDLDPGTGAVLDAVVEAAATVPWVGTAVILLWRWRRSRGGARRGVAVLGGVAGLVALTAVVKLVFVALYAAAQVQDDGSLIGLLDDWVDVLGFLGTGVSVAFVVLPLALLADVAWRRLAAAGVSAQVLPAAAGGTGPALDAAVAAALGEPTARVLSAGTPSAEGRGRIAVAGDEGHLAELDVDQGAGYTDDADHVESVVAALRLGLETAAVRRRLEVDRDEVDRSRRRVVEAAALERRRVERDLHDGAQQALLGLGAVLTRASLEAGPRPLADSLAEARSRLADVLVDLDRLTAGLHPEALDRDGLVGALEALADGCPLEVSLDVGRDVAGLPAAVESVVWFLVAECLTNAVRHARATSVRVRLARGRDALRVTVTDDGSGGSREVDGGGLAGLRDRVEAAGGSVRIGDGARGGTRVHAVVPLMPAVVGVG
jgi:signal transduction histidine kinase